MTDISDNRPEFSVYWWDPEGNYYRELAHVDAERAVKMAKSLTDRPAALLGVIKRVIITDGGDFTVFEWKHGEGVTYPTRDMLAPQPSAGTPVEGTGKSDVETESG